VEIASRPGALSIRAQIQHIPAKDEKALAEKHHWYSFPLSFHGQKILVVFLVPSFPTSSPLPVAV